MSRFLLTTWPLAGHYFPNLALAHALRRRGHEVAFFTGKAAEATIREEGFEVFPFQRIDIKIFDGVFAPFPQKTKLGKLMEKHRRYYAWLIANLPAQILDIEEVLDAWKPDVLVCDPMMWGPLIVLRETRHIKTAIFVYVPFSLAPGKGIPPLGLGIPRGRGLLGQLRIDLFSYLGNRVTADIRRAANDVRLKYGLKPLTVPVTEYVLGLPLYMITGVPELDFNRSSEAASVRYIGPCLWSKSKMSEPQWLRDIPLGRTIVHVTEGTVHTNEPLLLTAAARGLAGLNMDVIMATGTHRQPEEMGLAPLAPNIRVERWVSYDHLLPRTDLVVTTAGAGTVLSALRLGIPLVMVPTDWDKPDVALRTADAGAGILIQPERCNPQTIRAAVEKVLADPSFAANARRVAKSFERYGGPDEGAGLLEALAADKAAA